jgi:hypothetical protein
MNKDDLETLGFVGIWAIMAGTLTLFGAATAGIAVQVFRFMAG